MINKDLLTRVKLGALVVALGGFALHMAKVQAGNAMLIIGMGALAITFFISGFLPPNRTKKAKYTNYIINFSLSTLTLGLLFYVMRWNGGKLMLIEGSGGLAFGLLFKYLIPDKKPEQ